jgi:hypothetical protein
MSAIRTGNELSIGLIETSGPTALPAAAIPDNGIFLRSGSTIIGLAPSAVGDMAKWTGTAWAMSVGAKDYRTTDVVGQAFVNTTPSTVGTTVQYSGITKLGGTAWKSDVTAASQTQDFGLQVRPATGAASTTGTMHVLYSNNGAAWGTVFRFGSDGVFYLGASGSANYLSTTNVLFGTYLFLYGGRNVGVGVGTALELRNSGDQPILIHSSARTDGAGNVFAHLGLTSATGLWTNRATMRLLSLGVGKSQATATWYERIGCYVDGSLWQSGALTDASGVPIANAGGMWSRPAVEVTTLAASAYTDTTITIPAGAVLDGISVFVRTGTTTAVNVAVGTAGTPTLFTGVAPLSLAPGSKLELTLVPVVYSVATAIRITPDTTPGDANGRIVICLHYHYMTAAAA